MTAIERDLRRSSCLTFCLRDGQLEQVAQDHVQKALEYPQGWRFHSLSRQPDPVLKEQRKSQAVGTLQGTAHFIKATCLIHIGDANSRPWNSSCWDL